MSPKRPKKPQPLDKAALVERLHALGRHADAIRLEKHEDDIRDATQAAALFERAGIPALDLVDETARDPRAGDF